MNVRAKTKNFSKIENILNEQNIEYLLDAVESWGGDKPRILIPEISTEQVLYILVGNGKNSELQVEQLEADLRGRLNCMLIVERDVNYDQSLYKEKKYNLTDLNDIEAVKKKLAKCNFTTYQLENEQESTYRLLIDVFKPLAKQTRLKRAQTEALANANNVASEFKPSGAPVRREKNETDLNIATDSLHRPQR